MTKIFVGGRATPKSRPSFYTGRGVFFFEKNVHSKQGAFIAIAGNFGFAHYSVASKKWKLFGNIMQERDMVVTGGLTWWEDFVCVACYNLQESRDEIRLYPRSTNLDNAFAHIRRLRSQILLANTYQNNLIRVTKYFLFLYAIFALLEVSKIKVIGYKISNIAYNI